MVKEYKLQYNNCKKWQVTVDATPSYILLPDVPDRINSSYSSSSLSQKKFILLLRDPVSRYYSEYQRVLRICFRVIDGDPELEHPTNTRSPEEKIERANANCAQCLKTSSPSKLVLKKENAMSFAEFLKSPYGSSEMDRGNYLISIKRWLTVIDRSQFFILNFQQLIQNTTGNTYTNINSSISTSINISTYTDTYTDTNIDTNTNTITNINTYTHTHTNKLIDVMFRLSNFLNIDPKMFINDATNTKILLPKPPASNSYVEWDPAYLDCKTYNKLEKYYNQTNEGLVDFINSFSNKPKDEPKFQPFTSSRSKCK